MNRKTASYKITIHNNTYAPEKNYIYLYKYVSFGIRKNSYLVQPKTANS